MMQTLDQRVSYLYFISKVLKIRKVEQIEAS